MVFIMLMNSGLCVIQMPLKNFMSTIILLGYSLILFFPSSSAKSFYSSSLSIFMCDGLEGCKSDVNLSVENLLALRFDSLD